MVEKTGGRALSGASGKMVAGFTGCHEVATCQSTGWRRTSQTDEFQRDDLVSALVRADAGTGKKRASLPVLVSHQSRERPFGS